MFLLLIFTYFSVLQCTNHQPISVTDSVWSVNHVKPFISSCLQNLRFLNFALGRGCGPGSPPSLLWVRQCRPDIKPCTVVQPTYQRLNQRANGDAKFAADTRLEFQATINIRESGEVNYREVSTNCRRVVKFTSPSALPPWKNPGSHSTREWVGLWAGLDVLKRKVCFPLPEFEPRSSCLLATPTKISRSIFSKNIYKFNLKTLSSMYCFQLIYSTEQVWQTTLIGFSV